MSNPAPNDPVVDEVREVRRRISARFGHDPKKLVEHYIELQKQHEDRLVVDSEAADKQTDSAA